MLSTVMLSTQAQNTQMTKRTGAISTSQELKMAVGVDIP